MTEELEFTCIDIAFDVFLMYFFRSNQIEVD